MSIAGMSVEWISVDEGFGDDCTALGTYVDGVLVDVRPAPEVPPPVWDDRPIDPDRAMAAVRAMCA